MEKNRKKGRREREYQNRERRWSTKGKKYVSLKELSKDINVSYSPLKHRYYRTGDIEDAALWAANAEEKKKSYILWNRQYENVNSIA